jgi:hypothetical protein
MNEQHIKNLIPDYLSGELDTAEQDAIKQHITSCKNCREELENLSEIWTKLGVIPEQQPGRQIRTRFYSMLSDYKEELEAGKHPKARINPLSRIFASISPRRPLLQFALSLIFAATGLLAGYVLFSSGGSASELKVLRTEIQNIRQEAALTMLSQSSASDRLNGVTWSAQIKNPSNNTLDILLHTLDTDENENVRLAVVDALYLFSGHPLVKEGIIRSLSKQTSPLVQAALINLISELREKRAIQALRQLMKQRIEPEIRSKAELSIRRISNLDGQGAEI